MSASAFRKKKGKDVTRKMLIEKMDEVSALAVALETTLVEWEIWFRLLKNQKEHMTEREWIHVVLDGPIFSTMTEKIMSSIRSQLPDLKPKEEVTKPGILGADGNVANVSDKKVLVDGSGKPV